MSIAQPNGADGTSVTTPERDYVRPDEPGFELSEEWLNLTPWSSHGTIYGGEGNNFETLEKRELTAIMLASSLVSEAARTLPWGSEWGKWLGQISSQIYRAGRKLDAARVKSSDPHTGYLGLSDSYDDLLKAAGITTISQLVGIIDEHGGLQTVPGIGPEKEKVILDALAEWENLPEDEVSVSTARLRRRRDTEGQDVA